MSGTPGAQTHTFDMRAILAELERKRIESQKFCDDQHKLIADAAKRHRDYYRNFWPVLVIATLIGGIIGFAGGNAIVTVLLAAMRSASCIR